MESRKQRARGMGPVSRPSFLGVVTGVVGFVIAGFGSDGLASPSWIDGKDPRYVRETYVIGVGKGPTRAAADIDARAEVSRVFESKVHAVLQDFQSAASTVNESGKGVSVEVQKAAQYQEVTTHKTLEAVELREHAEDRGTHYTLALLNREQCVASLGERLEDLDGRIQSSVSQAAAAEGKDKLKTFKAYGAALNLMDEREGLNAMLRICDLTGRGIPSPVSVGDLASKFDEAAGNFRLGLLLEGSGASRVRDCVLELLGNRGYQITEMIDEETDGAAGEEDNALEEENAGPRFDAILRGKLKSERSGEIAGSQMVRTELTLKLIHPGTKKTLKTFTGNRKEGRPDVKSSAALSAYKLCQKEAPQIAKAIDEYFKR